MRSIATPAERRKIEAVAAATGAAFTGVWLDAALQTMIDRVEARADDASDATAEVVVAQAGVALDPIDWPRLDGSRAPANLARQVFEMLA
jgi:predicted kinase